uniref:Uncharacterized protein n=1 Tax=Oryza brachyantha TaxID=4533 RepID=J3LPR4_ORYBR
MLAKHFPCIYTRNPIISQIIDGLITSVQKFTLVTYITNRIQCTQHVFYIYIYIYILQK